MVGQLARSHRDCRRIGFLLCSCGALVATPLACALAEVYSCSSEAFAMSSIKTEPASHETDSAAFGLVLLCACVAVRRLAPLHRTWGPWSSWRDRVKGCGSNPRSRTSRVANQPNPPPSTRQHFFPLREMTFPGQGQHRFTRSGGESLPSRGMV